MKAQFIGFIFNFNHFPLHIPDWKFYAYFKMKCDIELTKKSINLSWRWWCTLSLFVSINATTIFLKERKTHDILDNLKNFLMKKNLYGEFKKVVMGLNSCLINGCCIHWLTFDVLKMLLNLNKKLWIFQLVIHLVNVNWYANC